MNFDSAAFLRLDALQSLGTSASGVSLATRRRICIGEAER